MLVVCEGKIVFLNPATLRLLAAEKHEDLLGRTLVQLVHPDERAEARRNQEATEGAQSATAERRMLRLDGGAVEVESRVIPFLFEGKRRCR